MSAIPKRMLVVTTNCVEDTHIHVVSSGSKHFLKASTVYMVSYLFILVFRDKVCLCNSPSSPGTHSVGQAGLILTEIHLPLPSKCWD